MPTGGCHCGAIRFEVSGECEHCALCHCDDCRRSSGAPMVGWIAFKSNLVKLTQGSPAEYASSADGRRRFCGICGTGLFFMNEEVLPGLIDVQLATFDDPAAFTSAAHIQTADRLHWMETAHELPQFERYPG